MVKTVIRHAIDTDFKVLLEIDKVSFPPGMAYDSTELMYFMHRDGAETLVLEADDRIAAFLILGIDRNRRKATIVTLDVRREYQRFGYGTQLMILAEQILRDRGVKACDLQVDVNNRGAIEFYEKRGFKTVRPLLKYYANGNDAYLMVKGLD